jgi:hypothetical protein
MDEMGGHVACLRDEKGIQVSFVGKDHSEDLGVDGRIILEWILGK